MAPVTTPDRAKNPGKVAGGYIGAARRWGPPRIIRLDGLGPEARAFIVELVDVAKRNATKAGSPADASGHE